ncbi:MAG: hypothetical protein P1P93_11520 [Gammaproteobacteria bacterium]|nr:hypothetical protein [Gammaproteobacteria bacterium]
MPLREARFADKYIKDAQKEDDNDLAQFFSDVQEQNQQMVKKRERIAQEETVAV